MNKVLFFASVLSLLSIEANGMTFKNDTDRKLNFYIYTDIGKAQRIELFSLEPNAEKQFYVATTLKSLENSIKKGDFLEFKAKYSSEYAALCGDRINVNTPVDLKIDELEKQTIEFKSATYSGCDRQ